MPIKRYTSMMRSAMQYTAIVMKAIRHVSHCLKDAVHNGCVKIIAPNFENIAEFKRLNRSYLINTF